MSTSQFVANQLAAVFDWQMGRYPTISLAFDMVGRYGHALGSTLLAGLAMTINAPATFLHLPLKVPEPQAMTALVGQFIYEDPSINGVVPGTLAELYFNFGVLGVFGGFFVIGRIARYCIAATHSAIDIGTILLGFYILTLLCIWTIPMTATLGVYLLKRQRPMASAWCFALGTVLKVSPIVAVPLFVLRRQWRWLAAYVAGVLAFTGVSIWQLGWRNNLTWLTAIYPSISSGVGNIVNRSFAGLVDALCGPRYFASLSAAIQWPVPHGLALFEKACSLAIGLGFIFWCWRKRKDAQGLIDELVLLPMVYLLAAPFSWPHHFLLAVLPLTYLWAKAREATSAELVALYLGTLALGTELPMYLAAFSPVASSYLIIVAIALWPVATCAIIGVGMRMYLRSRVFRPQVKAGI